MTMRQNRSSASKEVSAEAIDQAVDAYEELERTGFGTTAIRRAIAHLAAEPDKLMQALAFVRAYTAAREVDPDELDVSGDFASFMVLWVGRATLHQAIAAELALATRPQARRIVILLAELVDLLSEVTQPAPLPTKRELASLRLLFAEPETGPYAFVAELLALPAAERAMTVTALLAGNARALERVGLAGQLLLTPLDAATHACVRQLPV